MLRFWWGWSSISKVPKIASLWCLYNMSKKKLEMKMIFCTQIKIRVVYKSISTLWAPKLPTRWYYHYWWAWWSIRKVLKVTSFQISAISRKRSYKWSSLLWYKTFSFILWGPVQSCLLLLVFGWLWSKMGAVF